jgi:hypothetical protein
MAAWIGVDLDGTLAHYEGWSGIEVIGDPIPKMKGRVLKWCSQGKKVKIFTARVSGTRYEADKARFHIKEWLKLHGFPDLEITNVKDFAMIQLWDDRAIQVIENTGDRVDGLD